MRLVWILGSTDEAPFIIVWAKVGYEVVSSPTRPDKPDRVTETDRRRAGTARGSYATQPDARVGLRIARGVDVIVSKLDAWI